MVEIPGIAGSSPRVRGKQHYGRARRSGRRIIPARAGQTPQQVTRRTARPDHPRACGANTAADSPPGLSVGSSPRVRGKRSSRTAQSLRERIIPARAGQTATYRSWPKYPTDHPRACGANPLSDVGQAVVSGSSPRVRGKPRRPCRRRRLRIIPARAGQTAAT